MRRTLNDRGIEPASSAATHVGRGREMRKLIERIQEVTGIYQLGFARESFLGVALPLAFVVIVGGGLSAYLLMR